MDIAPDSARAGRCAIAIMAKAPQPGRSKTRLCPLLTPHEAALMSGVFLRDMAETVCRAGQSAPIDLYIAYAPAGAEAALREWVPSAASLLLATGEGVDAPEVSGFGRPLLQTTRALLGRGYGSVCLLNADSPTLPAALLVEAAMRLSRRAGRVVLGPATDGGYYLIGVTADRPALFAGIAWSTDQVADQTWRAARGAGLEVCKLAPWYDVDDPASLRRLCQELDDDSAAPATAAMLNQLMLRRRLAQPA